MARRYGNASDTDGFKRGAMGIDGSKDDGFTKSPKSDLNFLYGRNWQMGGQPKDSYLDCGYSEKADTAIWSSRIGKSAITNFGGGRNRGR
jgi:hypothetical protein